jgi:hypothetical protein
MTYRPPSPRFSEARESYYPSLDGSTSIGGIWVTSGAGRKSIQHSHSAKAARARNADFGKELRSEAKVKTCARITGLDGMEGRFYTRNQKIRA